MLNSRGNLIRILLVVPVFLLAALRPAFAAGNKPGAITTNGLIDLYYEYNFNHPPLGAGNAFRAFDVKNDSFSLSLAELNVHRNPTKKLPLGFTATLTWGKTADIVNATEPGGVNTYKPFQQLYITYTTGGAHPWTIDFGKFVTMMGYEVIESSSNDNYTRSFLFTYAIPFYHMGFRITHSFTPTLTGQFDLVNGWNNVEDDNSQKSIGMGWTWTPNSDFTWILNWMGGGESTGAGFAGPATGGNLTINLFDTSLIYNVTPGDKIGLNLDYATANGTAPTGPSGSNAQLAGHWDGWALYGRHNLSNSTDLALRLEQFVDKNGFRTGVVGGNFKEITATYEFDVNKNLINRIEFRHDWANQAVFPSGSGESKSQDTLLFGTVLLF